MRNSRRILGVVIVQVFALTALVGSSVLARPRTAPPAKSLRLRETAWQPGPIFDASEVVSDEKLRAVLARLTPRFRDKEPNVNFYEHALRAWKIDARFDDPACLSGEELATFLTDHSKFAAAFSKETPPLIVDLPGRLDIRVADKNADFGKSASRHHDHWLACLAESGLGIDRVVRTSRREIKLRDLLIRAVEDFRVDEREYEWSAMLFTYFLPDIVAWSNDQERELTFDLVAKRLMRADDHQGVCSGTHRLYALALLVRLHREQQVLSSSVYDEVCAKLRSISETLAAAQEEAGAWNRHWPDGASGHAGKETSTAVDKVLVTGHHLEWLSITPEELHPPRETIERAGHWLAKAVLDSDDTTIATNYTFYSHVVAALSNWRSVRPSEFLARGDSDQ